MDLTTLKMKAGVILFVCVVSCFAKPVKRASGDQTPKIWDALAQNTGRGRITIEDARDLYLNAKAGQDYPNLSEIPAGNFDCGSVKPGFYADVENKCQVIRRCDINGNQTAYLCPNMTIFNQITLVCDWFYNVDCSQAKKWYDYSNSRLYQGADVPLLDNQDEIAEELGAVKPVQAGRVLIPSGSKPAAKPAPAKPAPAKPAAKPTTAAPAVEETTTAAAGAEETPAPAAAEETTAAPAAEETTAAAAEGEEATPAAAGGEETTAAAAGGEEATPAAAGGEETTAAAAGGEESSAAPAAAEETTAAAAGEAAAGGEETTAAAAGAEAAPAAAGGEETTVAATAE